MRQVDFDGVGKQGRRNNKNDQQHQHDVDQRHHVDFRHGVVAAPVLEASESHDPYPLPVAASVTCRALPVVSPTGWPVVRKVNRSWAKASSRSEEHTSELQSLMRISYAVFCLKKKKQHNTINHTKQNNSN